MCQAGWLLGCVQAYLWPLVRGSGAVGGLGVVSTGRGLYWDQRDPKILLTAEAISAAWSCFVSGLQRAPWVPLIDQPCTIHSVKVGVGPVVYLGNWGGLGLVATSHQLHRETLTCHSLANGQTRSIHPAAGVHMCTMRVHWERLGSFVSEPL